METNRHMSPGLQIPDWTTGSGNGNAHSDPGTTGHAEQMNGGSYYPSYCYPAYPPPGAFAPNYGPAVFMGVQPMYMAPMMGVSYFVPADPPTHSDQCKPDAISMSRESRKALLARHRVQSDLEKLQPRRPRPKGADVMPALARGRQTAAAFASAAKREILTEHRAENQAPVAGPGLWDQRLDLKDLMLLLAKQLSPSGVSSLGRIVLPKREAEAHLPHLVASEGLLLTMSDFDTRQSWTFRYRFWSNNKSRMYLLENTRDFVKAHNLRERDMFFLYKDAQGSYVVRGEKQGRNQAASDHVEGAAAAEEVPTSEEEISRKNQTFEFLV